MDRGQYSDAVLNELESQNDEQVEGIMGKVRQLKDVSLLLKCLKEMADL
jgi:blocked-early-in-transport protein 1